MTKNLLFLFFLFISSLAADPFFYIIIPSYNNEEWCIKNIQSIVNQRYPHWKAVVINDCSTDKTGLLLEKYVREKKLQHRIQVIHNSKRLGMLANTYNAAQKAQPEWVIATVDGDDTLRTNDALSIVAKVYMQNPKIWMTYGSWVSDPIGARKCNCAYFPQEIIQKNEFRKYPYISSQLRTFYAALFQKIKKEDCQYKGKFFMAAGDVAFMIPMLEMASKGHFHYIKEPIYTYNVVNPINDFRAHAALRNECSARIRAKKPYKPLSRLF